ncbi:MAG TPA: hypothetical protein VLT47_15570 [Anaeromyxobacteraceae bacterium]|nr:hypothetical protein [Anaeromyxobacteraceae bacterium]
MATRRELVDELTAGGCTADEVALYLEVAKVSRRRARARRVERLLRALGAAAARVLTLPAALLLPSR